MKSASLKRSGIRHSLRSALGLTLAGALSCGACAHGQEAGSPKVAERLLSAELPVRRAASQELLSQRAEVVNSLMADLTLLLREPRSKLETYDSSFLLTLQAIGQWRVSEAIDPLMEFIAFDLGHTHLPVGARRTPATYYPVARTLAEIGGPRLPELIFQRLTQPADDQTLRTCTWVLCEVLTKEGAQAQVKHHLDQTLTVPKNLGETQTNAEKQNWERVEVLLKKDPVILQYPASLLN